MKIYKLLKSISFLSLVLLCYSCGEDKYYDLGGYSVERVNFTAVNLTVGKVDSASSFGQYNSFPDRDASFSLQIYYPDWTENNGEMRSEELIFRLDQESEIWAGGYNDIEITFHPSTPEEKEATFTMPDGSVVTATAESPTFVWHTDSLINNRENYYDSYIKAESKYKKGNIEYSNVGYIRVDISTYIRFNRFDDRWYYYSWIEGESMEAKTYTKFTAENLMISGDSTTSVNYNFPLTIESGYKDFSLPYYVYDDEDPLTFNFYTEGNQIYAFGNQKILFTFYPQEGEDSMILYLPTGDRITLTDTEPTYIWDFSIANAEYVYYNSNNYIIAESKYYHNGIYYYGQSEMRVKTTLNVVYSPENERYYRYAY